MGKQMPDIPGEFYVDLTSPSHQEEFYDLFILALCIWREARGESIDTKRAVAWVIRNRADHPGWWGGPSIVSVVLHPWQFSSFNHADPNSTKLPQPDDPSWIASLMAAQRAYNRVGPDPTAGAVLYFDKSMDSDPPPWSKDNSMTHCCDVGAIHFFRRA
jgi:spore germination cell wall hydrolase CwlJ-like protein